MNIPWTTHLEEMSFRSGDAAQTIFPLVDEESAKKLDDKESTTPTIMAATQMPYVEGNDIMQERVYSPSPPPDDDVVLERFSKHESTPVSAVNRSIFDDMEPIPIYYGGVNIMFQRLDGAHLPVPSSPRHGCDDGRCSTSGGRFQEERILLDEYITPDQINSADVLCGQGGGAITQSGNIAFRSCITAHQPLYYVANQVERAKIANGIVDEIKKKGGRFLKRGCTKSGGNALSQLWIDIGEKAAREKTRQALRERKHEEDRFALFEPTNKNDVTVNEGALLLLEKEQDFCFPQSPLAAVNPPQHFAFLSGVLVIGEDDVLLGRGGVTNEHIGTIIYRAIIREYQDRYISAPKLEKGKLVLAIVKGVTSIGGRFLRVKRGSWVEVSVEKARQQTSYALRQERRGTSPELAGGVRKSQSQPVKRQCMHEEYGDQEANLLVLKTAT